MSYTFAKELASKEADERMQELELTPEARAVLFRMAYAVNQGRFKQTKGEHTTTYPLGTARLMKETFLSEYRVNKAKTELRSKNLVSWSVNRTPVPGAIKLGKDGQPKQVYERNEYTIDRKALGIWWEPNKWAPQEEDDDSEAADEREVAQSSPRDSAAIAPVSEWGDAGRILDLCFSYCDAFETLTEQQEKKLLATINKHLAGSLTADLILSAIPECMEREHWIKKIANANSSQIGLMVSCIGDMVNEAARRRFLHGKKKSEDFVFVDSWQDDDKTWRVEIARGEEKRVFSVASKDGHIPTAEELQDYILTDLQDDPSNWDGSPNVQ